MTNCPSPTIASFNKKMAKYVPLARDSVSKEYSTKSVPERILKSPNFNDATLFPFESKTCKRVMSELEKERVGGT